MEILQLNLVNWFSLWFLILTLSAVGGQAKSSYLLSQFFDALTQFHKSGVPSVYYDQTSLYIHSGLLTRPWADEAEAEATQSEAEAEASLHEAEAKAKVEDTN